MPFNAGAVLKRGATAIAFTLFFGFAAQAQQQFVGQWYCESSYTEFDNNGNRTSGFSMAFNLAVQPDGNFYAEGRELNVMGVFSFQAQGGWGIENAPGGPLFFANGQMNGSNGITPFAHVGAMAPDNRVMFRNIDIPNTQTGGIISRASSECRRAN